jgi:hypothetical protein
MKVKWINLFWGVILIAAGALFLAQNLGYLDQLDLPVLMVIFTVVSLLFFVTYFANGFRNWGWLFPAFIFAALALVLWMQAQGFDGPWLGVPVLAAIALPFLVAFALSPRGNWWALIPAWVMVVISVILLFVDQIQAYWVGALVLFSIGFPFLLVYLADRKQWWALIPAWILLVIGLVVLLSASVPGEWIGALVLFAISFPFLVVYLADRQNWWALIPAWSLFVIGMIVLFSSTEIQGEWIATLVLMGIALPFFVVYFYDRDNWWAFIPAGVLASSAVSVFLAGLFGEELDVLANPGILTGITFLGITATFFFLWLQRSSQPTGWASYVAGVSLLIALVSMLFGASEIAFPIAIIAAGILILYLAFRSRKEV